MIYVESPQIYHLAPKPWVFMAGGITNCPDWQQDLRRLLESDEVPGSMLNPRRANFPIDDPNAARQQIEWEFHALNMANVFSVWFSAGPSPQPICMYELGRHLARWEEQDRYDRKRGAGGLEICIGVEPGYVREQDVRIQTELVTEYVEISTSLEEHAERIKESVEWMTA